MNYLLEYESQLWESGINLIAGVDEAGRGPLAGPMVVSAVILRKEALETVKAEILGTRNYDVSLDEWVRQYTSINDSKKLTEKRRDELYEFIINEAISYSIEEISREEVDTKGISVGVQKGFWNAVNNLETSAEHVLTDYVHIKRLANNCQTNITKGDGLSINIAAASILAKVYRDRLMCKYALKFPEYGFERHKGYGTEYHLEAIEKYGPCEIHRKTFEPVKSWLKLKKDSSRKNRYVKIGK